VLQPLVGKEFGESAIRESPRDPVAPLWDEADWLRAGVSAPLGPAEPPFDGWEEPAAADARSTVVSLLTAAPIDPDELARAAGLSVRELSLVLFALEAESLIARHPGGAVSARH
jgi:predicted Rossmann fold nucleotide-binding protein DprA/Smf involved in DNA uptake